MVSIVEAIPPHPTMLNTTTGGGGARTTRRVNPPMFAQGNASRSRSDSQLPELTRGSFAHHCLQTVVSKMGIEIQVDYFEKDSGILTKVLETVVSASDVPLSQTFQEDKSLAEKFQEVSSSSTHTIRCYAGDITGEEIELIRRPNDIEYILEAVRNHAKPVIILCKEPLEDSPVPPVAEEDEQAIGYTGRMASGMVQEMLSLNNVNYRTPRHHKSDSDHDQDRDSIPSTPGSSQHDSVFSLEEDLEDTLTSSLQVSSSATSSRSSPGHSSSISLHQNSPKIVHSLSSSLSMWRLPEELYNCEEEFLPLDSGRESDHESQSDAESTVSSISTRSYSKDSSSSSNGGGLSGEEGVTSSMARQKIGRVSPELAMGGKSDRLRSDPGYCTLPHPPKNGTKSALIKKRMPAAIKRISTIGLVAKKRKSVAADISSPSPAHKSSLSPTHTPTQENNAPWSGRRQKAIRLSKRSEQMQPIIHELSYSFQVQSVAVIFRDSVKMDISCREFFTVMELKDTIAQQLNKQDPDRCTPWRASDLILSYRKDGVEYELYNEWQFLYRTSLYESWAECQETSSIPLLADAAIKSKSDDLSIIYRLSHLAGVVMDDKIASLPGANVQNLRKIAPADRKEAKWARRTLHNFVDEVARSRDAEEYSLSIELVSSTASTILALKIPIDSRIKIVFHYKQCFSLVKHMKVQRTAESVLKEIFPCLVACGLVEDNMDAYTMQISGERSYIAGNHDLLEFKDIRRCIIKGEAVHISIAEKPRPDEDRHCEIKWLAIDPLSGEPPLHGDITSSNLANQDREMQALSVWDREDPFTLKILRADNLPLVSSKNSLSVIVDATLYHGEKPLCAPVTTSAQLLNLSVTWSETLNFKMAKMDVPKSAKILFRISEPIHNRESSSSKNLKSTKFLYWGLTELFDHQGMMYNGERVISLWKGKKEDKKETDIEDYQMPNPCGPASNNSDPKAVQLHIKFDSYGFPMYFPSCTSASWSIVLSQQKNTNVAVRRQFSRLLDYIRQGKLHSAVPAYIQKVNWGSLLETLEVYSLLEEIHDTKENFPVEVALKLLDCEFPDDKVRQFSTKVLEQMPDEKLEDFLLQLTQALKFEPNHDSTLARFLLKRALRNKRIGHYFFWYLKCEMYNPQYTTRFGVILEAYLKGCGESMLKQFEDQVEMQTTLERIGLELKQKCNDDHSRMQALLPEMLEGHGIPQFVITSVYNPRIRLGNLRPTKCKIMASKKKPQWLEMSNIDPTVLTQTPTRLILKIGDDLRQDMITLRMFSLFEKLWEEEGLDLALIPYGCIATGPNTGFIEVVKNARTIAEVSGLNNQTKLLDWIKSHQKNEFGEVDPDKLKAAVKTFIHSCAGYSVATYVLGIGDRHNDNIMVTTSGNLFHIDFGHFLGNIKYIMGFKREWAPFVLTPDFVWVMGGEDSSTFETYKNLCCRAFLILRRHSDLIINLFSLMRSTGIPELTCVEDTDYIRNALVLDKSEHEAEQMFRKVIKKCLDLKYTVQWMWRFHILRNLKKGSS